MLFLILASGAAAAAASLTLQPYTDHAPQKIVLNQVNKHGPANPAVGNVGLLHARC